MSEEIKGCTVKLPKKRILKGYDLHYDWVEVECENGGYVLLSSQDYANGGVAEKMAEDWGTKVLYEEVVT